MPKTKYELWRERYGFEYLRRLAEEGRVDEEIATLCGLELSVFRSWKKKYPEFAEAISFGRSESDYSIIKALYKKATGFNVGLKKTYKLKRIEFDPDTGKKVREYEELATGIDETYVPADLNAEKFWLKNRQSERWSEQSEKVSIEDSENETGILEIPLADMLDDTSED